MGGGGVCVFALSVYAAGRWRVAPPPASASLEGRNL